MLRQRKHDNEPERNSNIKSSKEGRPKSKKKTGKCFICLMFLGGLLVFLYVIIPAVYYCCPSVRRHAVFLNYISFPLPYNINEPQKFELKCARNFYISSEGEIKLGVWHIPAKSALKRCHEGELETGSEFSDNRPVFLYMHGNSGTRAGRHRVDLYRLLSNAVDAHIVTFDYRGYGDSTNYPPSANGLEHDATIMYNWLKKYKKASQIYLWGHSLGTAVTVRLAVKVGQEKEKPAGVILEAPFTNIRDASSLYPLSIIHRYMPLFETFFLNPVMDEETQFDSEQLIGEVKLPLLILHAHDDMLVPFELGERLYKKALQRGSASLSSPIFIQFDEAFGYGHKHIFRDPNLPNIVTKFMSGKLVSKLFKKQ